MTKKGKINNVPLRRYFAKACISTFDDSDCKWIHATCPILSHRQGHQSAFGTMSGTTSERRLPRWNRCRCLGQYTGPFFVHLPCVAEGRSKKFQHHCLWNDRNRVNSFAFLLFGNLCSCRGGIWLHSEASQHDGHSHMPDEQKDAVQDVTLVVIVDGTHPPVLMRTICCGKI